MGNNHLLRLLQISDPALPIGGFAHSAGLETYVQSGIIMDKESAGEFVMMQLQQNIHHTDAAILSLAFDAAKNNDIKIILELDRECMAVKTPRELRESGSKLGKRMIKIFQPLCEHSIADEYKKSIDSGLATGYYCVAFGIFASIMNINKEDALTGFYYNAAMGMIINSVKLIPLSQQDGQELIFSMDHFIGSLVKKSLEPDRDLIGYCCPGFDIRCMQHETLYSRLYMS